MICGALSSYLSLLDVGVAPSLLKRESAEETSLGDLNKRSCRAQCLPATAVNSGAGDSGEIDSSHGAVQGLPLPRVPCAPGPSCAAGRRRQLYPYG